MVWPGLSFQSRLLMKPSCFPAFFKEAKLWASSFLGSIATMGRSFFFLSAKCVVFFLGSFAGHLGMFPFCFKVQY